MTKSQKEKLIETRMLTPDQREQMAKWVREILGPEKARQWWTTKNPMLGKVSPWTMSLSFRGEQKLYDFIKDAYDNNRAAFNG